MSKRFVLGGQAEKTFHVTTDQDGDGDVNVRVNGRLFAWFSAEDGTFNVSGATVEIIDEGGDDFEFEICL